MSEVLRAEGVSFFYPQDGRGLPPSSLAIKEGEGVFISGPSGCGKSTLARCLSGLIPHLYRGRLEGEIWVGGRRTDQMPLWEIADQVGMVFQNPAAQMLAPSVDEEIVFGLENLGLSRNEIRARMEEALTAFGLESLRGRAPQTLSGGEQQKLALAAVTARQPSVLVLDEPLSMLDTTAAQDFIAQTRRIMADGKSVVLCEHRQEYLQDIPQIRTLRLEGNGSHTLPGAEDGLAGEGGELPLESGSSIRSDFRLEVAGLDVERGGKLILKDLSLSLPGGQVVAIVGRNGAGKTTLLRCLSGLQRYSGSIQACSGSGCETPQLGMVFQNPDLQLFNATVREEILYRLSHPDLKLYTWLVEQLGLKRYEASAPLLLSEGEKRRVALATALMRRPKHGILLDEPSLGQDMAHKRILMRLLRALAGAGLLVVFATHDLELAFQADRLILLGPAGIAADGTPGDIFQTSSPWAQLGLVLPDWVGVPC